MLEWVFPKKQISPPMNTNDTDLSLEMKKGAHKNQEGASSFQKRPLEG
jgi:hypothetical protein